VKPDGGAGKKRVVKATIRGRRARKRPGKMVLQTVNRGTTLESQEADSSVVQAKVTELRKNGRGTRSKPDGRTMVLSEGGKGEN